MKYFEAAIKILTENGNQPLSSREIWNKIDQQKLIESNGKTPWASLNTTLIYHSKPEYNKKIYFKIVSNDPMKFIISDLNIEVGNEEDIEILEKTILYSTTSEDIGWKKLTIYNNNENIEYELSDCFEYTYIIEDKAHSTIKIGKTKNNPIDRFNQHRTSNPSIDLLHVFTSEQWTEKDLHTKFDDIRKDLEWFFYTKNLKTFLETEIEKHKNILMSFNIKNKLEDSEKKMLEII